MTGGLGEKAGAVFYGTHLWIVGTEVDTADAGVGDGASAHRAGFEGDVEIAVGEALTGEFGCSLAQHQHFSVSGWVFQFQGAVSGAGEDFA